MDPLTSTQNVYTNPKLSIWSVKDANTYVPYEGDFNIHGKHADYWDGDDVVEEVLLFWDGLDD